MAPYKDSSYAEVLRWLEDTEIQYVSHGKRPGTKSYERYEKYSQAKTVVEALNLGSKPEDLLNDFEKKLLKRIGGPIRDRPINMAEVEDPSKLTATDRVFAKWSAQLHKGDPEAAKLAKAKLAPPPAQRSPPAPVQAAKSPQPSGSQMMAKMQAMRAGGGSTPAVGSTEASGARPAMTLAPKGLLARVLAGRNQRDGVAIKARPDAPAAPEASSAASAEGGAPGAPGAPARLMKVKKKLVMGGLLARVQGRAQACEESPEAEPASTPPSKRQRTYDLDSDDLAMSSKKLDAPKENAVQHIPDEKVSMQVESHPACHAAEAASPSEPAVEEPIVEKAPAVPPLPLDPTCHYFDRLANVLVSEAGLDEFSSSIGRHLQAIARSVSTPEAMLRAAMFFLDPDAVIPDRIIAGAIDQAFELPSMPNLKGEALAAQALSGCQSRLPPEGQTPLSIEDVFSEMHAASSEAQDEPEAASARLAKLLGSAQSGMEAFYLVRSLQGKLAPGKAALQFAVAKALVK